LVIKKGFLPASPPLRRRNKNYPNTTARRFPALASIK
jgi:hypothetical protein